MNKFQIVITIAVTDYCGRVLKISHVSIQVEIDFEIVISDVQF